MPLEPKKAADSLIIMNELVLPNDTNTFNNLMGGRLMYFMDIAGAICAQRHSSHPVVTASVDNVSFMQPIKLGDIVTIEAKVTRAFSTSMEVHMNVFANSTVKGSTVKSNQAYFTFVAVDDHDQPVAVPPILPETDEEKAQFDGALRRRQLRLVLGGRMKPNEATELKAIFDK